ncbi:hypothetical protein ASG01_02205 [Chryseobacterium sp. Leaf180]|uniref:hypothetical protein n=1 Tax=Chryseobacterium sp. Leaf180 TaxID=1736289 RepID=UPI0006F7121B|nr:hypothetical protein [Chryseobacterium sp. Leaf180]KQR94710.1 hypothetical protein ASG01_02205 [Chryseobacterium sp. Leaf180]
MIKKIKYCDIDFEKYNRCLENSAQRKYSATKLFLDITSGKNWDLLIYRDYEAVMPVPFVKKSFVKIVHNPMLCQQLGIFSVVDNAEINELFLNFFKGNYVIRLYNFNDRNYFKSDLKIKRNYLIFKEDYQKVYAKYSPKRKRKLRLDPEAAENSEIRNVSFKEAEFFIDKHFIGAHKTDVHGVFMKLFKELADNKLLHFSAFLLKQKIINIIALYEDQTTVALLGTFNDKNFVKTSGASLLIDHAIKTNIESKIFDFEGSELPNVEEFFRGFRPEMRPYPVLYYSKKEIISRLFHLKKNL